MWFPIQHATFVALSTALLASCQSVEFFENGPPDSVVYLVALQLDASGALVESTGIEPHDPGAPVEVVSTGRGTTLILGYTNAQVASSFEDAEFVPSPLAKLELSEGCDRALANPEWAVQWREGGTPFLIGSEALPALTTPEQRALGPDEQKAECLECPEVVVGVVEDLTIDFGGLNWVLGPADRLHAWDERGRYVVDTDLSFETVGPPLSWSSASVTAAGRGWAGTKGREIGRFEFEDFALDVVATATGTNRIYPLHAHPDPTREELLAVEQSGSIVRYRDGELIELARFELNDGRLGPAAIEYVDERTALVVIKELADIYVIEGDVFSTRRPIEGIDGYRDAENIPGIGTLCTHESGQIVRFDGDAFEVVAELEDPVGEIAPLAGGILAGAAQGGRLSFVRADLRQCPEVPLPEANEVVDIVPAGPDLAFVVGGLLSSPSRRVYVVRVVE